MKKKTAVLAAIALGLLLAYGFAVEPYWIEIRRIALPVDHHLDILRGKTALQLTDLHIDRIGPRERRLLEIVEEIRPDYVFLTGDYVPWNSDNAGAIEFFQRLGKRAEVYAVMGDYDYSRSRSSCAFCHEPGTGRPQEQHPVRFLRNSFVRIGPTGKGAKLGGVDEMFDDEKFKTWNRFSGEDRFPDIVLAHNPMTFDAIDPDRETLLLSGDTHGGQIPLPGWLWGIIGYRKNAVYNHGLFREGKKMMYVSRGIGTSHIPFRLFCRPEAVIIRF